MNQKDFLLLFQCILDFGAEVLRDFTEEKIKQEYQTVDLRIVLETIKHNVYHQWNTKKVLCCKCPAHGYSFKKTWTIDNATFDKYYNYNNSLTFLNGHVKKNGSVIMQNCICPYTARAIMIKEFDLTALNAFLRSLDAVNVHIISPPESNWIEEIKLIRNKVCHAVNTDTFSEPELNTLWATFTNAIYKLYPGDPKWIKKCIEATKKNILSQNEVQDLINKMDYECTDITTQVLGMFNRICVYLTTVTPQLAAECHTRIENGKIKMSLTIELPLVSKEEQRQMTEKIPSELKVPTDGHAENETITIDGKHVNSIVLDLSVSPGIFKDTESLRSALMSLIQKVLETGNIDTNVEYKMYVTLKCNSLLKSHETEALKGLRKQHMSGILYDMDTDGNIPIDKLVSDDIILRRLERKRTSTSSASSEVNAAATKKLKQHLEAQGNIPAHIASCSQGTSETAVILDVSMSTPTTSCSVDTVNSTSTTHSLNPVMTPTTISSTRCAPDTSSVMSEESKNLSEMMNGSVRSLPLAKLQQNNVKRHNKITKLLCDLLKIPYMTFVGSFAEGTDDSKSDKDEIWFSDNYDDFDKLTFLPDEGHPGYSKIHVDNLSEKSELKDYTVKKDGKNYLKNSVKKLILKDKALRNFPFELSIHGPAYTAVMHNIQGESLFPNKDREEVDHVFCIKCIKWPGQASEWEERKRASNWPTTELVCSIIKSGCLLAAVGSKESKESGIQWRVSFNKAEQLLIESFNETQLHCILLLKLLKKDLSKIAGKNITSYTMKNIMFWCLEEFANDIWKPSNLVSSFCLCVSKLQLFLEKAFLPNYFIINRNLFIASEFTRDIQTKTRQYLENFLKDPITGITKLLPYYRRLTNNEICSLYSRSQEHFIETWIKNQISMAHGDQVKFGPALVELYDGCSIRYIFKQCKEAVAKLTTVRYTEPLIKRLQNYMGVLQYIIIREEKETGEHRTNSDTREKYSKYINLSASGDLTHNTLRIATCYLDDGVKDDCLKTIRTVTDSDCDFVMQTHRERLSQTLHLDIEAFRLKEHDDNEISIYNRIINDIDLQYQDPYRTTDEFEQLKNRGTLLKGYNSLNLAWKRCYFDVTFMLAELPVLPKPAALELCIVKNQTTVSFHPLLYGLLLEYLWHEKNGSGYEEKEPVLEKMKKCVSSPSIIPDKQKSIGLNFMAYCYSLQNDYPSAFGCLARSLRLNPIRKNVAYQYMKYRIERLRQS